MGFFSWDCPCCGQSIKEGRDWMGKAVAVGDDGSVVKGSYDGYGRLDGRLGTVELTDMSGKFALYHEKCFDLAGKPAYSKPSRSARDQGCGRSFPEPQSLEDIEKIKYMAARRERRYKALWAAQRVKMIADYEAKGEPVPDYLTRAGR